MDMRGVCNIVDAYGHFSVRYTNLIGLVNADGVRLRSQPSLKTAVLELMYMMIW